VKSDTSLSPVRSRFVRLRPPAKMGKYIAGMAPSPPGPETGRSYVSPIQEVGCTASFRISDTRCGTCVIDPGRLQSRCSPS
jgi:hypothetical protein